jgi:hypothetical protein
VATGSWQWGQGPPGPMRWQKVPQPQPDRADGGAGPGIGNGEGQAGALGEPAALPADPLQGLPGCRARGQAADEGDVRVVPQLGSEVRVLAGELPQDD